MVVQELNDSILNTKVKNIINNVSYCPSILTDESSLIFDCYPEVRNHYTKFCNDALLYVDSSYDLLGLVLPTCVNDVTIYNLFSQDFEEGNLKVSTNLNLFRKCIKHLINDYPFIAQIAIQRDNRNWDKIKKIIDEETKDKIDVYVYYL